ncbi:MAG: trimethylamine methyltransferase family protein, partial [Desulfobacteraceae bacterium]|nr:trimethylamine methyltransferase family protein [Desulfobacteraceae bacterium]
MLKDVETFQPRLKVFNKKQAMAIHDAALKIIATTGFRMEHEGVLEMLLDNGCTLNSDNRVTMPEALVENAVMSAPKKYDIYDQNGNLAMPLEGDNCFFGTGSDTIFTIDLETGERRRPVLADTGNF